MGCRCEDIGKYEEDIKWLGIAEGHAQSLSKHAGDVRTTLTGLKGEYGSTVNAQDDLLTGFDKLDEGAQADAGIIITQLAGAMKTVQEWLKAAREEDTAFHLAEAENARRNLQ